jgi:hypothetical protein
LRDVYKKRDYGYIFTLKCNRIIHHVQQPIGQARHCKELLKNDGSCSIEMVPPEQKCPNPNQDVSSSFFTDFIPDRLKVLAIS